MSMPQFFECYYKETEALQNELPHTAQPTTQKIDQ